MRFNLYRDVLSLGGLTSDRAALSFGVCCILTVLTTVYFAAPGLDLQVTSTWLNVVVGIISVPCLLSPVFLWFGMRRFQKLRDPNEPSGSLRARVGMIIGLCYFAIGYYLFVYLRARNGASPARGPLG
jgi:hypothetical protein